MKEWSFGVPGTKVMTSGLGDCNTAPKPAITATRMKGEDITELRPIVVGQKPGKVVLELPYEAAKSLHMVCHQIGGSPTTSRRGHFQEIHRALSEAGVNINEYHTSFGTDLSSLTFNDEVVSDLPTIAKSNY